MGGISASTLTCYAAASVLAFALPLVTSHCGHDETAVGARPAGGRFLYVATPGILADLSHGGHGVLVFEIDDGHRFVKRIPSGGLDDDGAPLASKGICASGTTGRLYVTTTMGMTAFDLRSSDILWERRYEGGCDRMAITPDGEKLFTPSFEKDFWHVVDGRTGNVITRVVSEKAAHNTIVGKGGTEAYLADRGSRWLEVVDTKTNQVTRRVGPFGDVVRPFTVNGRSTLLYANVDTLLGFEVADLESGAVVHRVEVSGFQAGPTRHGCPSHGIGLTPDEREVWVIDGANRQIHVFDNTRRPPVYDRSIALRDEPGWVTFSLDGRFAYPSTGDVVDVAKHEIVTTLVDEHGAAVASEKMVEVDLDDAGTVSAVGDQFGVGRSE